MNVTAFKRRKEFGKTLASDIAHRMRSEIVTCRLKPGEVLKFDTLRLAYGASFTTLVKSFGFENGEGYFLSNLSEAPPGVRKSFSGAPGNTNANVPWTLRLRNCSNELKKNRRSRSTGPPTTNPA